MEIDIENKASSKFLKLINSYDKNVLETGCGDGRLTSVLNGKFKKLTAIDLDRDSLVEARENCTQTDFIIASGESLPFSPESFDLILFTQSLHHQNGTRALKEAERVLKNNGRILVIEPLITSELEEVCILFHNEMEERLHALYAVMESDLEINYKSTFNTIWRFENKHELHKWLFDYYDTPYNSAIATNIDKILEKKSEHSPLDIDEKLLIISLKRKN